MEWGILVPIAAITMWPIAWIANSWIRTRHKQPLGNGKGELAVRDGSLSTVRQIELLTTENGILNGRVHRLEERIAVLERIVTDSGHRTAQAIGALR